MIFSTGSAAVYAMKCLSSLASADVLKLARLGFLGVQPAVWCNILGVSSTGFVQQILQAPEENRLWVESER